MPQNKTCKQCDTEFEITDDDLEFLDKISPTFNGKKYQIPPPPLCNDCRFQRRYTFRDEKKLYKRKSNLDGAPLISVYSPDKKAKIYSSEDWWSDKWDATEFSIDFDFGRSFFDQFQELSAKIPRMQHTNYGNENCPFVNRCSNCKDSYLCFNADQAEDSFYCDLAHKLSNCVDCSSSKEMEFCLGAIECNNCSQSNHIWQCSNLTESDYCFDCHSGSNLILCHNLRNKNYCIRNVEYSKEGFEKKKSELNLWSSKAREEFAQKFVRMTKEKAIHRFANILKSEGCSGNNIYNSQNCAKCFEILRGKDLARIQSVDNDAQDSRDCSNIWDGTQLAYECMSVNTYNLLFSFNVWHSRNMLYCELCDSCQDCFGCVGLKHKQYHIFNKSFRKEEYGKQVAKLIEHMIDKGEWGEFFPMKMSIFGYNETVAMDFYPISEGEAKKIGANWQKKEFDPEYSGGYHQPDDDIRKYKTDNGLREDVLAKPIVCEVSKKPFKIMPQELAFYIEHSIPLPRKHYDVRYKERFELKNPRKLWHRKCMNEGCNNEFETTYAPDRPEKVYCESCYQKTVI